jgi:hypothetical protein
MTRARSQEALAALGALAAIAAVVAALVAAFMILDPEVKAQPLFAPTHAAARIWQGAAKSSASPCGAEPAARQPDAIALLLQSN